ncbi:hypothetical protein GARCT_03295 [Geobacillus sp. 12AMOR1]|nr:hypothetical protein GARCT_03295 [Geobacillus sp. 12AMOR1]
MSTLSRKTETRKTAPPPLHETVLSDNVQRYVELIQQSLELEKRKKEIYSNLSDQEKQSVRHILTEMAEQTIPDDLHVRDVALLLDVTPQMVRRYCAEGKIEAYQRLGDSGKWIIPAAQFFHHPNWPSFLQMREQLKSQSIRIAEKMEKEFGE